MVLRFLATVITSVSSLRCLEVPRYHSEMLASVKVALTGIGLRTFPPRMPLFGKTIPSAAQRFGIEREIETARGWLVELARNPTEALAQTWTPKMKEATDSLGMAFNQRNDTVKALGPLQTSVVLLIDDVNRELDRLEGDLKKLFPGQTDRVASYLAATRNNRSSLMARTRRQHRRRPR
jgi:hypothetical protein